MQPEGNSQQQLKQSRKGTMCQISGARQPMSRFIRGEGEGETKGAREGAASSGDEKSSYKKEGAGDGSVGGRSEGTCSHYEASFPLSLPPLLPMLPGNRGL